MNNFETIELNINGEIIEGLKLENENTLWFSIFSISLMLNKSKDTVRKTINKIAMENKEDGILVPDLGNHSGTHSGTHSGLLSGVGMKEKEKLTKYYSLEIVCEYARRIGSNIGDILKSKINEELNADHVDNENPIIIYNNGSLQLDIRISPKEETVWLTQNQIAQLYETTRQNITYHINNIAKEGELDNDSTHNFWLSLDSRNKFSLPLETDSSKRGNRYLSTYYNLDMILAIGYRVKSKRAVEFRRWVSSIMKQYLIQGYAVDQKRLSAYSESILELQHICDGLQKDINALKDAVFEKPPIENLFYEGKYYDSFAFVNNLICSAKQRVIIIDGYADNTLFDYFINSNKSTSKIVYCAKPERISSEVLEKFQLQYGHISIVENKYFHDRFLVVDDDIYILGASLNALGNKRSCAVKLISTTLDDLLKK